MHETQAATYLFALRRHAKLPVLPAHVLGHQTPMDNIVPAFNMTTPVIV